jgi:hypothetical protein
MYLIGLKISDDVLKEFLSSSGVKLSGELTQELQQTLVALPTTTAFGELCLKLDLFLCEDSGICKMAKEVLKLTFDPSKTKHVFILDVN